MIAERARFAEGCARANLGVRIATGADEIDAVQALRYRVFYGEMGARADVATQRDRTRPRRL